MPKTMGLEQAWTLCDSSAKNSFYISLVGGKKTTVIKRPMNVKILWNSNFGVHRQSFIKTQTSSLGYILSMAAFALQGQTWLVTTEIEWLRKPKSYLLSGCLQNKFIIYRKQKKGEKPKVKFKLCILTIRDKKHLIKKIQTGVYGKGKTRLLCVNLIVL